MFGEQSLDPLVSRSWIPPLKAALELNFVCEIFLLACARRFRPLHPPACHDVIYKVAAHSVYIAAL